MDFKKYKVSICRYLVTKCYISSPNLSSLYSVPVQNIEEIILDNDYEHYYYPYFQINMQLPSFVERAIKKSPLDIHIDFAMQVQYYSDRTGQSYVEDSVHKFIEGKYIAYIEKQDRSLLDSQMEEVEDSLGYSVKQTDIHNMESCKFTLYNESLIDNLDTVVNAIISNDTLVNILAFVLTKANISNVLLSPPTNNKRYCEFKLPPQRAYEHIERICHNYGLHSNGTLIYHGLDRSYIIDKSPKCTAYTTNEYQTTHLYYQGGSNNVVNTGCAKSNIEKANLLLIQPTTFKFSDLSVAAYHSISDDIVALDPLNMDECKGGNKSDYAVMIGGDDTTSAIKRATSSYSKVVHMGFGSIDLNMLTPNKHFLLTLEDIKYKKYTGSYMLTKSTTSFSKDGIYFNPITTCVFKC